MILKHAFLSDFFFFYVLLQVYGETSFELVEQMIKYVKFSESDYFIDLGSGKYSCFITLMKYNIMQQLNFFFLISGMCNLNVGVFHERINLLERGISFMSSSSYIINPFVIDWLLSFFFSSNFQVLVKLCCKCLQPQIASSAMG